MSALGKMLDPARFLKVIEEAKKSSDYVIVYVHWGTEGMLYPQEDMRQLAQSFVQAGADAVIGNHSHRLQGVEYIDGVPVFYGLGNFWFSTGALYTTIVQIRIHSDGTLSFAMLPCIQQELTTRILTEDGEKAEFCRYIADLSVNAAIEENGSLMELTPENAFSETEGAWYLSGSDYASRSGAYDLTGARIDIVGNRE